ncbi:MAG: hypothetical protein GX444_04075 [Myxococcales bacterium]|nr:hypothetical protein [Myxococcales bacterium]
MEKRLVLLLLAILFGACFWLSACDCNKDDADRVEEPADDDTLSIDPDPTCGSVAEMMNELCTGALPDEHGNVPGEAGLKKWCELSAALMPSETFPPFWECLSHCFPFGGECDSSCVLGCLAPPNPGSDCGAAIFGIYHCNIEIVFKGTDLWIPQLDLLAICDNLPGYPMDCYLGCWEKYPCSDPIEGLQHEILLACINGCG